MSNEDINKSIAEFCGWNQKSSHFGGAAGIWTDSSGVDHTRFPDYCKDLNAMHEAEMRLTDEQWDDYAAHLRLWDDDPDTASKALHSTALQRAEAFLRTIGKWEEGKWEEIGKVEEIGQWEESR